MSSPTREGFQAHLAAAEARMDARVISIEGKIDMLVNRIDLSDQLTREQMSRTLAAAESAARSAEKAGDLKRTLWLTSVTTIFSVGAIALAAYFGTQQSNIGILQAAIASFDLGRSVSNPAPSSSPASTSAPAPTPAQALPRNPAE